MLSMMSSLSAAAPAAYERGGCAEFCDVLRVGGGICRCRGGAFESKG